MCVHKYMLDVLHYEIYHRLQVKIFLFKLLLFDVNKIKKEGKSWTIGKVKDEK